MLNIRVPSNTRLGSCCSQEAVFSGCFTCVASSPRRSAAASHAEQRSASVAGGISGRSAAAGGFAVPGHAVVAAAHHAAPAREVQGGLPHGRG